MKKLLLSLGLCLSVGGLNAQTALDLDGTGNSATATVPSMSTYTIEYDFYMHGLMDWNSGITQTTSFQADPIDFYITSSGAVSFFVDNAGGFTGGTVPGVTLVADQWYHIAYTMTPTQAKLYIDGLLVHTITMSADTPLTELTIGTRDDDATNANAKFDNVRLWSTVRSDEQILNNKSVCMNGDELGLVVLYDCEEGSGTTLTDMAIADGSQDATTTGTIDWTAGMGCMGCPDDDLVTTASFTHFCEVDTSIDLSSSEEGVEYYLVDTSDYSIVAGPVVGDGSAISFATGLLTSSVGYEIQAGMGAEEPIGLEFSGSSGHVDLGDNVTLEGESEFTIEAWVNTDVVAGGFDGIISKHEYLFRLENGKPRSYFYPASGGVNAAISTLTLTAGQWYFVSCTYDGTESRIYVDGVDVTGAQVLTGTGPLLATTTTSASCCASSKLAALLW